MRKPVTKFPAKESIATQALKLVKSGMKVSMDAVARMRMRPVQPAKALPKTNIFTPYVPMKGVLPATNIAMDSDSLAMDSGFDCNVPFAAWGMDDAYTEGYVFPGFQVLAQWAQVSEFRKPSEIYAREMTREWIKFVSTDEEDTTKALAQLEEEFKRLNVQAHVRHAIELDGLMGRGQIFLDMGDKDPSELLTDLAEDPSKVSIGSLKALRVIEPMWTYPSRYNANDPLDENYYNPECWFVMGKEIHRSRLLTIVTRKLPDVLKPAYSFAGLSLSQMMKPYVDNWIRTRQSVSDLVHSFTVWTLSTDMSQILANGGAEDFFNRLQIFNLGRDNHGINAINKDTEGFSNVSASLSGLDHLQAQAQEQMCAPTGIPLVYLTGITPSGLNASSEGEIRVFQDTVSANQELYTPVITKIMNIAQLSLWGKINPKIRFIWQPLYSMSEGELATARKTEADTDIAYIEAGVITPEEVRTRIAKAENTPYQGLDADDVPEPPMDPSQDPEMMGGQQPSEQGEESEWQGGEEETQRAMI